jgi:hypothetical protein
MSERLRYLLTIETQPLSERDRIDSLTAAARMPGRRQPRWARHALVVV